MAKIEQPLEAPLDTTAAPLTMRLRGAANSPLLRAANGRLTMLGKLAMVVVCVAVFLTALDQTVVVTALTYIIKDIDVPITQPDRVAWIVSGYLLGYVIAMPLMGRLADVFGRWRVFAVCLALFLFGSLLCTLAPTLGSPISPDTTTLSGAILAPAYGVVQWLLGLLAQINVDTSSPGLDVLVGARFLQAIGGGALVPVAMAVVSDLFGGTRRGLALGLVGAVTEAGGVLGPLWGAWLTVRFGWQVIFSINIPLALLLLIVGFFCIPRQRGAREPIDLLGALLFGASLICLTVGLGQQTGAAGTFTLTARVTTNPRLLLAAAILFLLFLVLELRLRWPVVEPAMFRRLAFAAAALLSFFTGVALIITLVEIPLYMASLLNYSAIDAGLALLRLTALIPFGALAGGWLSNRFGTPVAATIGTLLTALGLWQMSLWPINLGQGAITLATVSAGLGFGLVIAPISTSALNASEPRQSGVASAVVTALRMTGMIIGLAGLTAWGLTRFQSLMLAFKPTGTPGSAAYDTSYTNGLNAALHQVYTDIFAAAAIVMLLGVVPALLLWRRNKNAASQSNQYESFVAPLS